MGTATPETPYNPLIPLVLQILVMVFGFIITIVTLWFKFRSERQALEVSVAVQLAEKEKLAEAERLAAATERGAAAERAKSLEKIAVGAAAKAETAVERAVTAVAGIQAGVDGIEKIRNMVDGQRTAMVAELKTQTVEIQNLKSIIAAKDQTAAVVAATKKES